MISIFKNLYSGTTRPETDAGATEALYRFAFSVLDCVDRFVLTGEGSERLRRQLAEVAETMQAEFSPEQVLQAEGAVSQILAEHHRISQESALAQAVEVQHIFAMLNQSLIVLAEGRDRSVSRLNEIQGSLQRTSLLRDIVALKSALADTVRFVQEESKQAHQRAAEDLGRFEAEVSKVRDFIGNTRIEPAGRAEGIVKISDCLKGLIPGQAVYVVAYLCDRLQAVAQRYGTAVAEELIFRVIKERIQPVAPGATTYRWTPSSLVSVVCRPRDLAALQLEVTNLNRTPVVHRIALGNRNAVLTMAPSHMAAEAMADSSALLIEQLDKFTGAHA